MNPSNLHLRWTLAFFVSLVGLVFAGCDYDVPLSVRPDRPINDQLAGNWMSPDAWMMVRRFDAENYVVVHNGSTYRAWHSTVAGRDFVTVQSLDGEAPKFAYLTYSLSADGRRLELRVVRGDVIPNTIKDTDAMREAVARRADDAALLTDPVPFVRMK